ncbi:MAG: 3'-5' exonuclease [Bacteroidales bacterium]|jgi:3'-5' exonuclease|nr:3'-5' exonuclease [Bacteroidales bacterium]MBS3773546.1 3'-5' exonuclease [Bacteroidales bacterium]
MLEQYNPEKILFLDIETVPRFSSYSDLPEKEEELWQKKASRIREDEETAADTYSKAGIYAEFGKVICISVGLIVNRSGTYGIRVKSFYGDDEKNLLSEFTGMVNKFSNKSDVYLCAHNGKEFDFPYIIRRLLINGLPVPEILNVPGKKPWEVPFLDTMELWKFGDYKNYTSLDLLAYKFDIPTPKDDIDGSMVGKIYWQDQDLSRIVRYCEKDAMTVAQLFLRYKGMDLIDPEHVEYVTE